MKNVVLIIGTIVVLVGGFFIFNSYIYNEKQSETNQENKEGQLVNNSKIATLDSSDWNLYSNGDFSVKYPNDRGWIYEDQNFIPIGVSFGTPESRSGGFIWGASAVNTSVVDLETLISRMGSQFADRSETRSNITINGVPALLVSVTTNLQESWMHKQVFIEGSSVGREGRIYIISNGAIGEEGFDEFYKSFQFIN